MSDHESAKDLKSKSKDTKTKLTTKFYDKEYPSLLKYPFKSKFKYFEKYIKHDHPHTLKEPYVHDFRLKDSKKLAKPNFSNEPGCWECDLMFTSYLDPNDMYQYEQINLVAINVNTRYLIVEPINGKDKESVENALIEAICKVEDCESCIKTIKCDGEGAFGGLSNDGFIVIKVKNSADNIYGDLMDDIKKAYKRTSTKKKWTSTKKKGTSHEDIWADIQSDILNNEPNAKEHIRDIYESTDTVYVDDGDDDEEESKERKFLEKGAKFEYYCIKWVIDDSPYTLAHKHVDAVIRTLRNAFGMDNRRLADENLMQQMVDLYNNTPHSGLRFKNYQYDAQIDDEGNPITGDYGEYVGSGLEKPKQTKWIYCTPNQVQHNIDLEWRYIRMMRSKLQTIKNKMSLKGLLSYSPGNIILIHLEKDKTKKKHEKVRRVFNEIAEFICYKNGNVVCSLLKPYQNFISINDGPFDYDFEHDPFAKPIQVPIIYTKFVCESKESLPEDYIEYFGL